MTAEALTFDTHAPGETRAIGSALARLFAPGDVVLLSGQLGAGKTELAKGIAEGLGIEDTVVSPTFTIVREYEAVAPPAGAGLRMLHVDVYRLDHAQEVLDLGLEDLAADEAVTIVEWGDAVAGLLPADHLLVEIELGQGREEDRSLRLTVSGSRWVDRRAAIAEAVSASA